MRTTGGYTMVCSGEEYLGTKQSLSVPISPGITGLTRLDTFARMFEEYKIDRWTVKIRPVVGTTTAGSYVVGGSYDYARPPATFNELAVCSPKATGTVWQPGSISMAPARLMRQKWLITSAKNVTKDESVAGYVGVALDGATSATTVAVWVDYSVTFQGPSTRTQTDDVAYLYNKTSAQWTDDTGRVVQTVTPIEQPVTLDVEIASGDSHIVDAVMQSLATIARHSVQLHRYTVEGITYVHVIADALSQVALTALHAATILHVARAPFRAALRGWGPNTLAGSGGAEASGSSAHKPIGC